MEIEPVETNINFEDVNDANQCVNEVALLEFSNVDELKDFVTHYSKDYNFDLAITSSRMSQHGRITFECSRRGEYSPQGFSKRKSCSKKCVVGAKSDPCPM